MWRWCIASGIALALVAAGIAWIVEGKNRAEQVTLLSPQIVADRLQDVVAPQVTNAALSAALAFWGGMGLGYLLWLRRRPKPRQRSAQ